MRSDEIEPCCSRDLVENHSNREKQQNQSSLVLNVEDSVTPVDKDRVTQIDGEEIVSLCRQLDTQLDDKARAHNLSAINVKSILHHLIKNPQVISALMGLSDDAASIPTVKLTRSKTKHKQGEKVELKPVNGPKTFLDVQYENDDEDDDYRPEEIQNYIYVYIFIYLINYNFNRNADSCLEGKSTNNGLIEDDLLNNTLRIDEEEDVITQYQLRSRVRSLNDAAIHDPLADSNNDLFANCQEQDVCLSHFNEKTRI
uniref:GON-4-like protein n=1 Tax=Heterorhabditis bacteriophora TaxID=37862 RepID=A0A1I7WJG3_HETBA